MDSTSVPAHVYIRVTVTLFTVGLFCFSGVSIYSHMTQRTDNHCEMTWMRPNYHTFNLSSQSPYLSKKYRLLRYTEGSGEGIDPKLISYPTGIPVLFIHGNAGSFNQARSLAAESARGFSKRKLGNYRDSHDINRQLGEINWSPNAKNEFDWYTLDFKEELVALSGLLMYQQTEFANVAVKFLLNEIYGHLGVHKQPSSVIIVAHSMGGMVARGMPMMPNYHPNSIRTIVTMATPHRQPPILCDALLVRFYENVNMMWRAATHKTSRLHNTVILSIAGGHRDQLIHAQLPNLHAIAPNHSISVMSSAIPGMIGVENDHLSILWCNQLVKRVVQTLFDIIETADGQDTMSVDDRRQLISNRFIANSDKIVKPSQSPSIPRENIYHVLPAQQSLFVQNPARYQRYEFDLAESTAHVQILTDLGKMATAFWCESPDQCQRSSPSAIHIPVDSMTFRGTMAIVELRNHAGRGGVLVLEFEENAFDPHFVMAQSLDRQPPIIEVQDRPDKASSIPWVTSPHALRTSLEMPVFSSLFAYTLRMTHNAQDSQSSCPMFAKDQAGVNAHYRPVFMPFYRVVSPQMQETTFSKFWQRVAPAPIMDGPLHLHQSVNNDTDPVRIDVFADPRCAYTISFHLNTVHTAGILVRQFLPITVGLSFALLILAIARQASHFQDSGVYPPLWLSIISSHVQLFPWVCVILLAAAYLVNFQSVFDLFQAIGASPIARHSFSMLDTEWPSPLINFGIYSLTLPFLLLFNLIISILVWMISWFPWFHYKLFYGGKSTTPSKIRTFSATTYVFRASILLFMVAITNSGIILLGFLIMLLWSTSHHLAKLTGSGDLNALTDETSDNLEIIRYLKQQSKSETPSTDVGQQRKQFFASICNYQHAWLVFYTLLWMTMAPGMLVFIRNLIDMGTRNLSGFPDHHYFLVLPPLLHIMGITSTALIPEHAVRLIRFVMYIVSAATTLYAAGPIYRIPDITMFLSLLLVWTSALTHKRISTIQNNVLNSLKSETKQPKNDKSSTKSNQNSKRKPKQRDSKRNQKTESKKNR